MKVRSHIEEGVKVRSHIEEGVNDSTDAAKKIR